MLYALAHGQANQWVSKASGKVFKRCMHCPSNGCTAQVNWCAVNNKATDGPWKFTLVCLTHTCTNTVTRKRTFPGNLLTTGLTFFARGDRGDNKQLRLEAAKHGNNRPSQFHACLFLCH